MVTPALLLLTIVLVAGNALAKSPERGGVIGMPYRVDAPDDPGAGMPGDAVIAVAGGAIEEGIRAHGLAAVSANEISLRLARVAYSPDAGELRTLARAKLDAAYQGYFNMDLAAAGADLDEAANALARASQMPEDLALLSDLKLLSGMIKLASTPDEAARDFDTVVRLTPARTLDSLKFPPHAITALAAAEERFRLTPVTQVNVETTPSDVRVAIDGVVEGRTPLSLDRIATGEHYYRLEKAGYAPQFGRVVLGGGKIETLRVHLEIAAAAELGAPIAALAKLDPSAHAEQLVRLMNADKVVLARVSKKGPRKFHVVVWWVTATEAGTPVIADLSAEPSDFVKGLVAKTREALASPVSSSPEPIAIASLARDQGLAAAGRAGGRLDPPPPAWYRRWQVYAGAAGAAILGGLALIARDNAQPGTVDYKVSVQDGDE